MSRKRLIWTIALTVVVLGLAGIAWSLRGEVAYAHIATGYAAKQTCSCIHVSGRTMESCMAEYPSEARGRFSVTEDANTVRASVLFGAISAQAMYEDGFGCRIVN